MHFTAVAKQGCLFSGDGCYGIPTALPRGMYFPYGSSPNFLPVHPIPIYEGLFHLVLFAFLLYWDRSKKQFPGHTALLYFILAPAFYILLGFIQLSPRMEIGLTVSQVLYGGVMAGGLLFLYFISFNNDQKI